VQAEALGEFVGGGRAADGTVVAVDRLLGTGLRLFVAEGGSLTLRRRNGTGASETSDAITLSSSDGLHVRIELLANGAVKRIGIFRGAIVDPKSKSFEIGKEEELSLLTQAALSSFTLESVVEANASRVSHSATTPDQRKLIVISGPLATDPLRVFFGTSDRMAQRRVINQSVDHTLHLTFDLDGVAANALLTRCGPSPVWGSPRITMADGTSIPLTPVEGSEGCPTQLPNDAGASSTPIRSGASLVAGNQFFCL
jgi:hypothetical protein